MTGAVSPRRAQGRPVRSEEGFPRRASSPSSSQWVAGGCSWAQGAPRLQRRLRRGNSRFGDPRRGASPDRESTMSKSRGSPDHDEQTSERPPRQAPPHLTDKKADRAPSVEAGTRGAASVSRLRPGAPATPEGGRLRLLPSGPDLVHGSSSPRDRTIDAAHRALTPGPGPLGRGFSPARADCGYRAPLAPRLARSRQDRSAVGAKNGTIATVVVSGGDVGLRAVAPAPLSCSRTKPTASEAGQT